MEQIKRLELQCSENDSSASNQELKRVIAESHNLKKPKVWVLQERPDLQFTSDGKRVIEQMFWYLWDNKQVHELFVNEFLIKNCEAYFQRQEVEKAQELIEVVVNDLFLEHTGKFPEWRLVEI